MPKRVESFTLSWLPQTHSVADSGFRAEWDIPSLGSNYRKSWTSDSRLLPLTDFPTFGVNLISPINPYRMAQRSLKYELLFFFVSFLVMWMLEVMGRSRIHTIHYSLVGAAICLFYLLLLSLSEHISFGVAYALASLAVVALLTGYGRAILGGTAGGLTLGTVTSVLYAFLYPTFLISTSDPISSDLPVMNDQNLSALHPRINDSLGIFPPEKGL